ncbi:MAG: hypothetical protein IPP71_05755 [Bacteroidetes bacterium]|nr:hypothetical protein [Bacteroidota bacterium]
MKSTILVLGFSLLLFCSYKSNAQNRNMVWTFGDSAGIDFTNIQNPIPIATGIDGRGSCVSISDTLGELIFSQQQVMCHSPIFHIWVLFLIPSMFK